MKRIGICLCHLTIAAALAAGLSLPFAAAVAEGDAAAPAGHEEHGHEDANGQNETGPGHGDHSAEAGQDSHDEGEEAHDHEAAGVGLTPAQMDEFGVRLEAVAGGPIAVTIERPAEVVFNENTLAHVVPRVGGIASAVRAAEGDRVAEGEVLAVLESRELADAKAGYLANLERLELAKDDHERAAALIDKKIVSEKTYLSARSAYAEARINLRSARQKLFALGLDAAKLEEIASQPESDLTEYVMRAPLSGTVVKRHLSRGEAVGTDREAFVIADVSTVWVDVSLYAHDLEQVKAGQPVAIASKGGVQAEGRIAFVTPNVSEETRTARARVELSNSGLRLRPGLFVSAQIAVAETAAKLRVPASAVQRHEGREVVFVRDGDETLEARPVTLGRRNGRYAEVLSGLKAGEEIVTDGAFVVKSQLAKAGFDDGHHH